MPHPRNPQPSDRPRAEDGPDWSAMPRSDFDPNAPLALVDARAVHRPVLAVPDACGTEALFGEEPASKPPARQAQPALGPAYETDALF